MPTVPERVKKVIAEHLSVHTSECSDNADLMDDLGADSLDKIDLIMQLENEFNRSFNDEDFTGLNTVGEIIRYIEERVPAVWNPQGDWG